MQPDLDECDCGNADCPTCSYAAIDPYEDDAMPDPVPAPVDPAAAELARVVAWLRARAERLDKLAKYAPWTSTKSYRSGVNALRFSAADLERGEQP